MKINKQTPTQIASEIMNMRNAFEEGNCDICEINGKILAYRTAWKNELEDWKWVANTCNDSRVKQYGIKKVSELTSALKILEGEQK